MTLNQLCPKGARAVPINVTLLRTTSNCSKLYNHSRWEDWEPTLDPKNGRKPKRNLMPPKNMRRACDKGSRYKAQLILDRVMGLELAVATILTHGALNS